MVFSHGLTGSLLDSSATHSPSVHEAEISIPFSPSLTLARILDLTLGDSGGPLSELLGSGRARDLTQALRQLNPSDREALRRRWGRALGEIESLAHEHDRRNFYSQMFQLGQRFEDSNQLEMAGLIYSGMAAEPQPLPTRHHGLAQSRLDAIHGTGPAGAHLAVLSRSALHDLTDYSMILNLGVARAGATLAEGLYAGTRTARLAASLSPGALSASRWLVRSGTEAAIFTAWGMGAEAHRTGHTDHLTLENFGRQWAAMLVTFGLLHGVGMTMGGFNRALGEHLTASEAGLLRARGSGIGLAGAQRSLLSAQILSGGMGAATWGSRVLSLTGAGYLNEGLGLEEDRGESFAGRMLGSAVMDAQMTVAGRAADGLSGGALSRMEHASQGAYESLTLEAPAPSPEREPISPLDRLRRLFPRLALPSAILGTGAGLTAALTPDLAHAAFEVGARGHEGPWPALMTGAGILGVGVLGMVAASSTRSSADRRILLVEDFPVEIAFEGEPLLSSRRDEYYQILRRLFHEDDIAPELIGEAETLRGDLSRIRQRLRFAGPGTRAILRMDGRRVTGFEITEGSVTRYALGMPEGGTDAPVRATETPVESSPEGVPITRLPYIEPDLSRELTVRPLTAEDGRVLPRPTSDTLVDRDSPAIFSPRRGPSSPPRIPPMILSPEHLARRRAERAASVEPRIETGSIPSPVEVSNSAAPLSREAAAEIMGAELVRPTGEELETTAPAHRTATLALVRNLFSHQSAVADANLGEIERSLTSIEELAPDLTRQELQELLEEFTPDRPWNLSLDSSGRGGLNLRELHQAVRRGEIPEAAPEVEARLASMIERYDRLRTRSSAPSESGAAALSRNILTVGSLIAFSASLLNLFSPELAHASVRIGEASSDGLWPMLVTGAGILGLGALGMVAGGGRRGGDGEGPREGRRFLPGSPEHIQLSYRIREAAARVRGSSREIFGRIYVTSPSAEIQGIPHSRYDIYHASVPPRDGSIVTLGVTPRVPESLRRQAGPVGFTLAVDEAARIGIIRRNAEGEWEHNPDRNHFFFFNEGNLAGRPEAFPDPSEARPIPTPSVGLSGEGFTANGLPRRFTLLSPEQSQGEAARFILETYYDPNLRVPESRFVFKLGRAEQRGVAPFPFNLDHGQITDSIYRMTESAALNLGLLLRDEHGIRVHPEPPALRVEEIVDSPPAPPARPAPREFRGGYRDPVPGPVRVEVVKDNGESARISLHPPSEGDGGHGFSVLFDLNHPNPQRRVRLVYVLNQANLDAVRAENPSRREENHFSNLFLSLEEAERLGAINRAETGYSATRGMRRLYFVPEEAAPSADRPPAIPSSLGELRFPAKLELLPLPVLAVFPIAAAHSRVIGGERAARSGIPEVSVTHENGERLRLSVEPDSTEENGSEILGIYINSDHSDPARQVEITYGEGRPPLMVQRKCYLSVAEAEGLGLVERMRGAYHQAAHVDWIYLRPAGESIAAAPVARPEPAPSAPRETGLRRWALSLGENPRMVFALTERSRLAAGTFGEFAAARFQLESHPEGPPRVVLTAIRVDEILGKQCQVLQTLSLELVDALRLGILEVGTAEGRLRLRAVRNLSDPHFLMLHDTPAPPEGGGPETGGRGEPGRDRGGWLGRGLGGMGLGAMALSGIDFLNPALAHASIGLGEASGGGWWPMLVAGAGILGAGAIAMVGRKNSEGSTLAQPAMERMDIFPEARRMGRGGADIPADASGPGVRAGNLQMGSEARMFRSMYWTRERLDRLRAYRLLVESTQQDRLSPTELNERLESIYEQFREDLSDGGWLPTSRIEGLHGENSELSPWEAMVEAWADTEGPEEEAVEVSPETVPTPPSEPVVERRRHHWVERGSPAHVEVSRWIRNDGAAVRTDDGAVYAHIYPTTVPGNIAPIPGLPFEIGTLRLQHPNPASVTLLAHPLTPSAEGREVALPFTLPIAEVQRIGILHEVGGELDPERRYFTLFDELDLAAPETPPRSDGGPGSAGGGSGTALAALLAAGAGVGATLFTPEVAHAATHVGETASNGFLPALLSGAAIVGAGALGMVRRGPETYREASYRDSRLMEARGRFREPTRELRDRVRAISDFSEVLRDSHTEERETGILELIDLAISPEVPELAGHFAASPEDPARILRTFALEAVNELLREHPPEPTFRRRCVRKMMDFFREASSYLRPEYITTPEDWPTEDPRYLSPELIREQALTLDGSAPSEGFLDVNVPLRSLGLNILRLRLSVGEARGEQVESRVRLPPTEAAQAWHHFLTQTPSLRFLYTNLSLGLSVAGLATFFSADSLESGLGLGMAALGGLAAATPELLHRFMIRPTRERRARWTEYLEEHREFLLGQAEMGIPHPFAALRLDSPPPPRTRVELAPEVAEPEAEAEAGDEIDRAIQRGAEAAPLPLERKSGSGSGGATGGLVLALSLMDSVRAEAQDRVITPLQQAGLDFSDVMWMGAAAGGLWLGYRFIDRLRVSYLGERARSDSSAIAALVARDRPGRTPHVLQALARAAEVNPEAVLALRDRLLEFGNMRAGYPLIADLPVGEIQNQALNNDVALEALNTLAEMGNRRAAIALRNLDFSGAAERARDDVGFALTLRHMALAFDNLSARRITRGLEAGPLIERAPRDWHVLSLLNYLAQIGNREALAFVQSFDPAALVESVEPAHLSEAVAMGLVPMALFGNPHAQELLIHMNTSAFAEQAAQDPVLLETLALIGERGNGGAVDTLTELARTNPLSVIHLAQLAQYGNQLAANLLQHVDPSVMIAAASGDAFAFKAMAELAQFGNLRAREGLARHFARFPEGRSLLAEALSPEVTEDLSRTLLPQFAQICMSQLREYREAPVELRREFLRRIWRRWNELPTAERTRYYEQDQARGIGSLIPFAFIHAEAGRTDSPLRGPGPVVAASEASSRTRRRRGRR